MKANGHTPGPWRMERTGARPERLFDVVQDANPFIGLGSHVTFVYVPANEANARLIAAAPEMLAELQFALRDVLARIHMLPVHDVEQRPILETQAARYRAVIAKATTG